MDLENLDLNVGDSIVVKPGVFCPDDDNLSIEGWQGRIEEIDIGDDGELLILVEWDSVTLKAMPQEFIEESVEEGLDYAVMYLEYADVEKVEARDSIDEVRKIHEEIDKLYSWDDEDEHDHEHDHDHEETDEKESIIEQVLYEYDDSDPLQAWKKYLKRNMKFPFNAVVFEDSEKNTFKKGDSLKVLKVTEIDEYNGIMVTVDNNSGQNEFPLCNLEVQEEGSQNYLPLQAYCEWFVNR